MWIVKFFSTKSIKIHKSINLFLFIFMILLFYLASSFYLDFLGSLLLGFIFSLLCWSLIFKKDYSFSFILDSKFEIIISGFFLLTYFILVHPSQGDKYILFIPWENIIWSPLLAKFILAIFSPFIIGYIPISLMKYYEEKYPTLILSFFMGTFIITSTFIVCDVLGTSKYVAIIFITSVELLLKIIYYIIKSFNRNIRYTYFSNSSFSLLIFLFAIILYSIIYLNSNSFVKGDFWKHTAMASSILLSEFEKFLRIQSKISYSTIYPSLFPYFLASMSEAFSIPLINYSIGLVLIIPSVSVLAVLYFFSVIDEVSCNRTRWATLVWFTFSGFGMFYLLLEYNTLQPSYYLSLILFNKLGWGSGFVYSPTLGSFAHILRLFSLVSMLTSQAILIRNNITKKHFFLSFSTMLISLEFHILVAILCFLFTWFTFYILKPKIAMYLYATFVLSLSSLYLFDLFLIPEEFYPTYEGILLLLTITIITVANVTIKRILKLNYQVIIPRWLLKLILMIILFCYFYSFILIYFNYNILFLSRFPIIPLYAWVNILGIPGFLTITLLGILITKEYSLSFGEKYFIIFAILGFFACMVLDYINVYQITGFFSANSIVSFRLIPIVTIPISYFAGSVLYRLSLIVHINSIPFKHKKQLHLLKKAGALIFIFTILFFIFISLSSRMNFWMNTNWPVINFKDYQVSDEEISLIHYLRNHISEDEIIGIEDNLIDSNDRYGKISPLGQIVSLSGANVISKTLGLVLFHARSVETINLLKETLNIKHIVIRKGLSINHEFPSYLKDIILKSIDPSFETDNYIVYKLPSLLNSSKANLIPNIFYNSSHYGIFSGNIELLGDIKIQTTHLQIGKIKINSSIFTNINVYGNLTLTFLNASGNLTPSSPYLGRYSLNFDGIDDYVEIPNLIKSEQFTIQFWAKINTIQKSNLIDLYNATFLSEGGRFTIGDSNCNGHYAVGISDGFNFIWSNQVFDLSDYKWHNIAVSFTNTEMDIYMDGTLKQAVNITETNISLVNIITPVIKIGNGLDGHFNGKISNILFYNRTCTPDEIRFNMLTSKPSIYGLQLFFDMSDYSGTTLYDKSGNKNNGTIYGASWCIDGVAIQLIKPTKFKLDGASKIIINNTNDVPINKTNITGEMFTYVILTGIPTIRIEGNTYLGDSHMTWPYIKKIGAQEDFILSGVINSEVINTHDVYIPLKIDLDDLTVLTQNLVRERLVYVHNYFYRHYHNIDLFFYFSVDFKIFIAITLLPLGYILLVNIINYNPYKDDTSYKISKKMLKR